MSKLDEIEKRAYHRRFLWIDATTYNKLISIARATENYMYFLAHASPDSDSEHLMLEEARLIETMQTTLEAIEKDES